MASYYTFGKPFFSGSGYCYPSKIYDEFYKCGAAGNQIGGAKKKRRKTTKTTKTTRDKTKEKLKKMLEKFKKEEKKIEKKLKTLVKKAKRKLSDREKKERQKKKEKARKMRKKIKEHRKKAEMKLKKHVQKTKQKKKKKKVKRKQRGGENPPYPGPSSTNPHTETYGDPPTITLVNHSLGVRSPHVSSKNIALARLKGGYRKKKGGACCNNLPENTVRSKPPVPTGNFLFNNYGVAFKTSAGGAKNSKSTLKKMGHKMKRMLQKVRNAITRKMKKKKKTKSKSTSRSRSRSKQRGGDDAMGATYLPMRFYNPKFNSSGRGVASVKKGAEGASCLPSAYGPIVGRSFPATNLAPYPNSSGTQTGGKKKTKTKSKRSKSKRKKSPVKKRKTKTKRKTKKKR